VIQVIPSTLIVAIVQYVWIIQIRSLSRSRGKTVVTNCVLCSVLIQTVMSITLTVIVSKSLSWGAIRAKLWAVMACFVLKALNDVSLMTLLCYHLQRSKNGFRETDNMIQKIMGYGFRAGLFNCMGSLASMFLMVFIQTSLVYVCVYLVFSRLYTISLLSMLNWRPQQTAALDSEEVELSTMHWSLYT